VTAAGGGFHFDPDKVQTAINELNAILDKLQKDIPTAGNLARAAAPGRDPATAGFQKAIQESHTHHLDELYSFRDKVQNQVDNLNAAMKQYHETEAGNRQGFGQKGV
jgi:outer membrane murein-binding lipoprotein Lpp